jgi:hypothetical protein
MSSTCEKVSDYVARDCDEDCEDYDIVPKECDIVSTTTKNEENLPESQEVEKLTDDECEFNQIIKKILESQELTFGPYFSQKIKELPESLKTLNFGHSLIKK